MKQTFKSLKNGIFFWIGAIIIFISWGIIYAAWDYTTTVNTSEPLTAEMWNSLKDAVQANPTVPTGWVIPFNLASCPTGWSELTSARWRTIIWTNPSTANWLSVRALNATLWEEDHVQTIAELASHHHTYTRVNPAGWGSAWIFADNGRTWLVNNYDGYVDNTWTSTAFNVMQPSLALLYCVKD
jgi:hypothetical protein